MTMNIDETTRRLRVHCRIGIGLLITILAMPWTAATADEPRTPADTLMQRVPPDAGLVIVVEGLRDRVRELDGSQVVANLRRLPMVRAWRESEDYQKLQHAFSEVEAAVKVKLANIRDRVLGDAVVLALRLPPDDPFDPSQARGLLLLRASDPELLRRLITTINQCQRESGELTRVVRRRRVDTTYHVREFPEASGRPSEYYVAYPDGTFAFSNSEEMIQAVIDRSPKESVPSNGPPGDANPDDLATSPGLGESPRLKAVRERLPSHPIARLYVDPRAVERLLSQVPAPEKPDDARILALLRRHLSAVDYAGAALAWESNTIAVHAVETLKPARVDAWLRRWAADARPCRPELARLPHTALAMISAHVNLPAFREALYEIVPTAEHPRLDNLQTLLKGLFLGHDLDEVLPAVGPRAVAYLDAPESPDTTSNGKSRLFAMVMIVEIDGSSSMPKATVADAMENAFRTLLAVLALDDKHGRGRASIATTEVSGTSVRSLNIPIPFAYALDRAGGRLVLGTSAPAIARYLEAASDPSSGERFRDWRASAFSGYETYLCIDLEALTRLGDRQRTRLARRLAARQNRPADEVRHDLEDVLSLSRLFRAAFAASRIEPDASAMHRCFGLILNETKEARP